MASRNMGEAGRSGKPLANAESRNPSAQAPVNWLMRLARLSFLFLQISSVVAAQETDPLRRIRDFRLAGNLAQARELADQRLAGDSLDPSLAVHLHLELARIHDRIGLHQNTRPVAAAMEHVRAAAAAVRKPNPPLEAAIELARAEYLYRTELGKREFPGATASARRAVAAYQRLGDRHGEAEAVHLLGLISLQRGDLKAARQVLDRSLALDSAAGARAEFQGEYERHIGYVALFEGDTAAAIPHLERSLALRRQVGAIDASLFAATTLAGALVDQGRLEDARPHVLYAMTVAAGLDSPYGRAQLALVVAKLYRLAGERDAARIAFETALKVAESVGAQGLARAARSGIADLAE
jgi:tetratricopeptide (TPR) repeat protein